MECSPRTEDEASHDDMNRSYSWINVRYAFVAGLLMIFAASAMAQPRFGLSPEAYAAYNRWMLASCLGGDERSLVDDLRRHAQALSPAFEQAIVEGPTDEEIAALRAAAEQRYAQRATFPLEQFRISGVSRQDLAKFRTVSRQDYVSNQVRRFTTGYRSK